MSSYRVRHRRAPLTPKQKALRKEYRKASALAEALRIGAARLLENTEPDEEGVREVLELIESEVLPKAAIADRARDTYEASFGPPPKKKRKRP
ncbi:MAG: hypothetical protein IVW54_16795 [Candidatus Binataceae bacterium]|nr:hypothetical protein [Candidatus Binataceae bacterium]